jgi:hypothetical protein
LPAVRSVEITRTLAFGATPTIPLSLSWPETSPTVLVPCSRFPALEPLTPEMSEMPEPAKSSWVNSQAISTNTMPMPVPSPPGFAQAKFA